MSDFWEEFRNRWNDSYWWADHQLLMALLLGLLGLAFHAARLFMERKWGVAVDGS